MGPQSIEDSMCSVAQDVAWIAREIAEFLRITERLSRRDEIAARMMDGLEFEDFGSCVDMAVRAQRMADELIASLDATEQPK